MKQEPGQLRKTSQLRSSSRQSSWSCLQDRSPSFVVAQLQHSKSWSGGFRWRQSFRRHVDRCPRSSTLRVRDAVLCAGAEIPSRRVGGLCRFQAFHENLHLGRQESWASRGLPGPPVSLNAIMLVRYELRKFSFLLIYAKGITSHPQMQVMTRISSYVFYPLGLLIFPLTWASSFWRVYFISYTLIFASLEVINVIVSII